MKKFTEEEIKLTANGYQIDYVHLAEVMRNQNEMVDFLKDMFPREMRREPQNEVTNSTG